MRFLQEAAFLLLGPRCPCATHGEGVRAVVLPHLLQGHHHVLHLLSRQDAIAVHIKHLETDWGWKEEERKNEGKGEKILLKENEIHKRSEINTAICLIHITTTHWQLLHDVHFAFCGIAPMVIQIPAQHLWMCETRSRAHIYAHAHAHTHTYTFHQH